MIEITSRFAIILVKYSKFNKRRHPNKSIGMGKFFKINKGRAYVYSELKSRLAPSWVLGKPVALPSLIYA